MPKLIYCARLEGTSSGTVAAEDLCEVFELSQRHPTIWDGGLGQYVPNPHYAEDAFLEWNESLLAIALCELGMEQAPSSTDGQVWALDEVREKIAAFKRIESAEEPDGIDDIVHALDRLAELGARHGGSHLVAL